MKVLFTPTGRRQFLEIVIYIYQDNPVAAVSFRKRADQILSRLKKFPESGRMIPEFPELPYREIILKPYRFFYKVKDNNVWVVAVWHSAQIPNEPLL